MVEPPFSNFRLTESIFRSSEMLGILLYFSLSVSFPTRAARSYGMDESSCLQSSLSRHAHGTSKYIVLTYLLVYYVKMQRIVLLSSLLWWELGTNSLITGPGEWLSFRRFTSKLSWSWSWQHSFCHFLSTTAVSCANTWARQANLVLIAYASSDGSGEPAHPRSLARTSAARSYKQWVKRNLQTESQIPGPSEWLGMRS